MTLAPDSRPELRAVCRLSENPNEPDVLLFPEGLLKLAGPGRMIVQLCDGRRTFAEIVASLQAAFPAAPAGRIESDTRTYIERLRDRGVLQY